MNHDRLEALLWEWIDGEIDEPDLTLLKQYLAEHPEAREEHRRLLDVSNLLSSLEPVEAPAGQRERIEAALASRPAHRPPAEAAPRARAGRLVQPWPARLAYLAAGLVVGVVVTALLGIGPGASRGVGEPALRGVMFRHLENGESHEVNLVNGAGRLVLAREGRRLHADLDLRRSGAAQLAIQCEAGKLSVESLDQVSSASVRLAAAGRGVLVSTAGPTRLRVGVVAEPKATDILVRITAGGEVLASSRVQLGPGGEEQ